MMTHCHAQQRRRTGQINKTVNLLETSLKFFWSISLNHKKSRSSSSTRMFKNADCMSPGIMYLWDLNRTKISNIFDNKEGSECKLSLIERSFWFAFALYTVRSFVVSLFTFLFRCLTTSWCGSRYNVPLL